VTQQEAEMAEFARVCREANQEQITCWSCGTPWEGQYNHHGIMNSYNHQGYALQVGGHDPAPDVCHACGAMQCEPECIHHDPNWEALLAAKDEENTAP
jgi:hypothetical protein